MELSETVGLMQSADFKERFKAEYYQAKIRYERLFKMLVNYEAGKLDFEPKCGIDLLKQQLAIMVMYLAILRKRAAMERIELSEEQEITDKIAAPETGR